MAPNPELYKQMAAPYDTAEAAHAAIRAFLDDVAEARKRHRIAEVAMIAGGYVGSELVAMTQTLGDQGRSLRIATTLVQSVARSAADEHEREAARLRALAGDDEVNP